MLLVYDDCYYCYVGLFWIKIRFPKALLGPLLAALREPPHPAAPLGPLPSDTPREYLCSDGDSDRDVGSGGTSTSSDSELLQGEW